MTAIDYASLYETEFRTDRQLWRRANRVAARAVWAGLLLVRPRLALEIWRERH